MFDDYSIEYRNSINGIENKWDQYTREDLFLKSPYLKTLESVAPSGMQFRYVCLMEKGKAIGVLYFQIIKRSLADSLQGSGFIQKSLASLFRTHILINGNTLVTGSYGYHFLKELNAQLVFQIINTVSDLVRSELKKDKIKIGAHLKKDYHLYQVPDGKLSSAYSLFQVQPNMHMVLDENWSSFEDYKQALKSKYRVRLKRARKKAVDLEKREMNLADIKQNQEVMYKQYMQTVEGAGFNLFYLDKNYNAALKERFGELFKVWGYFSTDDNGIEKLLGYYTIFINGKEMDAHFLGYEHSMNAKYQTYFNFLIDMIEYGISKGYTGINMSRTALEIKSSVGATAEELKVFMKYNNGLINKMLPRALDYFVPKVEWTPRTPFK